MTADSLQMQIELTDVKEEKHLVKTGRTTAVEQTKFDVASKVDESVWRKAVRGTCDWLRQYTVINVCETLLKKEGNYDSLEKFFAMMVLMNALVFAMSSSMATAVSFEELQFWYEKCQSNDGLLKCLRNYNHKNRNGKDVCSTPIREFQLLVTVSHQMLAFSLFVSAAMYLYVMAFVRNVTDKSEENKDKEHLSDEQLAAFRKERQQTWALFALIAIGEVMVTVTAIVYYQLAYNQMVTLKFIVFAWQKGEHCTSHNVRAVSGAMGRWLVAVGLVVVCTVVSCVLGRIKQTAKPSYYSTLPM